MKSDLWERLTESWWWGNIGSIEFGGLPWKYPLSLRVHVSKIPNKELAVNNIVTWTAFIYLEIFGLG